MTKIIVDESILEHLAQEKDLFSRTEFSIIPCATKEQAYKIHSEEIADLIIIDFDMPEMNVESFCAHVRTNKKLKHVSIAIAWENKRDYLDRCLMCGVNALIIKPVYHKELIANVIKLLNIKKREDTRVLLRISLIGSTTGTFYATAQNISVSGMLIETDKAVVEVESFAAGTVLKVVIQEDTTVPILSLFNSTGDSTFNSNLGPTPSVNCVRALRAFIAANDLVNAVPAVLSSIQPKSPLK